LPPLAEREVIAGLPDGLIVLDSRGLVAEINQHAPRLLGIHGERWIGRSLAQLITNSPFEHDLRRLLNTSVTTSRVCYALLALSGVRLEDDTQSLPK